MNPFWDRATKAKLAAETLLGTGDAEGAANRAYFAMFNARRALLAARTDLDVREIRRHSAILKLFAEHAVKPGLVERRLNAAVSRAFDLRAAADYGDTEVGEKEAADMVQLAEEFLLALEPHVADPK